MENQKEHNELMTKIAVFEATVNGKFDSIISHLASLNGQTSKNTGAIAELQTNNRSLSEMIYRQGKQEKDRIEAENARAEEQDEKKDSWKKRWQDLLFGTLQYLLPLLLAGILFNGRAILDFLGIPR